jgi:hypothetical protein
LTATDIEPEHLVLAVLEHGPTAHRLVGFAEQLRLHGRRQIVNVARHTLARHVVGAVEYGADARWLVEHADHWNLRRMRSSSRPFRTSSRSM